MRKLFSTFSLQRVFGWLYQPEFSSCEDHAEYIFNKENAFVEAGYPVPHKVQECGVMSYCEFLEMQDGFIDSEFLMRRADLLRRRVRLCRY